MRLLFKNPVFHAGINVTVRLGTKWGGQLQENSTVEVWDTDRDVFLFDAFIHMVSVRKICDIPQQLLDMEHDPSCHTHKGLIEELGRVYRKRISSRDTVTVIAFSQSSDASML